MTTRRATSKKAATPARTKKPAAEEPPTKAPKKPPAKAAPKKPPALPAPKEPPAKAAPKKPPALPAPPNEVTAPDLPRTESAAHAAQRKAIRQLIVDAGLSHRAAEIEACLKHAIGLRTRRSDKESLPVGASKVGGCPDLPPEIAWPDGDEGPLLFVLQVRLEEVAPHDIEGLLPATGLLTVFADRFCDDVRVLHLPGGAALARRDWRPEEDEPFVECAVDVLPELQLPRPSSPFVAIDAPREQPGSRLRYPAVTCVLSPDEHTRYWDAVWLPWRRAQRPGNAGEAGIHQLLGYAGDDGGEQGIDDELLIGFDSDDRAKMEWGDVQCVWGLIDREDLLAGRLDQLRATL